MKKLFLTLIVAISVIASGCSKKDDPVTNDFIGTWAGIYNGDNDSGDWWAEIDANGDVTGGASSSLSPASFELVGTITPQGEFTATAGSASNGTLFTGEFTKTSASGTWSNSSLGFSGTWSGARYDGPLQ
jgi:hypothetical protein